MTRTTKSLQVAIPATSLAAFIVYLWGIWLPEHPLPAEFAVFLAGIVLWAANRVVSALGGDL